MNIIFFGNGLFALESLINLNATSKHKIQLVVTNKDKKKGRGMKSSSTPIGNYCDKNTISVLKTDDIISTNFINILKSYNTDLFIVIEYKILKNKLLAIPKFGSINIHGSLLPKYRGAAPIHWAIMKGESVFGVTSFLIEEKIDTGKIIIQSKCVVKDKEVFFDIYKKLAIKGSKILIDSIELMKNKNLFKLQNTKNVTLAPKIKKSDYRISFNDSSLNIHNKLRALNPKAYAKINSKKIKLFNTYYSSNKSDLNEGEHRYIDNSIYIGCNKGCLVVKEVQFENKNKISSQDFHNIIYLKNERFN